MQTNPDYRLLLGDIVYPNYILHVYRMPCLSSPYVGFCYACKYPDACFYSNPSLFDFVGSAEHFVDSSQIVGAREEMVSASLRYIALFQMSLLTEIAHLQNQLARPGISLLWELTSS